MKDVLIAGVSALGLSGFAVAAWLVALYLRAEPEYPRPADAPR